jgi:WD40 repeat protein
MSLLSYLRQPTRRISPAQSSVTPPPAKKFDAFISYSRDPDSEIAKELQYGLQHAAKAWYQRRSMRIFLDNATMPIGGPLWGTLKAALDDSKFLVLIASPSSASRPWVNREVEYWISDDGRVDNLIIVLAGGKIKWDDDHGDFDWSIIDNALPKILSGKYRESPLFADFRDIPAERDDHAFSNGVFSIAAKIRGLDKDDLQSEDRRQHRRTIRIALTTIIVLVLMLATAVFLGKVAMNQRDVAREQTQLALSRELAASATVLAPQDIRLAALLAVESNRLDQTGQAQAALLNVVSANPPLRRVLPMPGQNGQLSNDGSEIAIPGSTDVTVRDTSTGRQLGNGFDIGPKIASQGLGYGTEYEGVISYDDRSLAIYDPGRRVIELWDIDRHRLLATAADPAANPNVPGEPSLVFSPDGRYLLSTGWGGAYVFNAATLQLAAGPVQIPGSPGGPDVDVAAFSSDGRYLLMAGDDIGADFILSTANWQVVSALPQIGLQPTVDAAFSPNGRQLAIETGFGTDLYELTGSPETAHFARALEGSLNQYTVTWNPVGSLLASGGDDGTELWNPATGEVVGTLRLHPSGSRLDGVNGIAFARSGSGVITSGADGVITWQPDGSELEHQIHIPGVGPTVYSPNGKLLATVDGRDGVQLRNAETGTPVGSPIRPAGGAVQSIAFVGTSGILAIGNQAGTTLWNIQRNVPEGPVLVGLRLGVADESASPDGAYIAVAENYDVRVWDVRDRRLILTIPSASSLAVEGVIGPDGRTLAVTDNTKVEIWDIPGRRRVGVIQTSSSVNSVAFTSNGEFLAINTATPATRLWDLQTRQWASASMSNGTLSADSDDNNPVAVDGDTSLVASASGANDSVTLWNMTSSSQIGTLDMPDSGTARVNAITSVAFSPDERYLEVTSNTGYLALWDVSPNDWVADACAIAGRELTPGEWSQYIGSSEPYQRICS